MKVVYKFHLKYLQKVFRKFLFWCLGWFSLKSLEVLWVAQLTAWFIERIDSGTGCCKNHYKNLFCDSHQNFLWDCFVICLPWKKKAARFLVQVGNVETLSLYCANQGNIKGELALFLAICNSAAAIWQSHVVVIYCTCGMFWCEQHRWWIVAQLGKKKKKKKIVWLSIDEIFEMGRAVSCILFYFFHNFFLNSAILTCIICTSPWC